MTQCSQLRCALVVGEGVNLSQTSFAVVVFLKRKFQTWKTSRLCNLIRLLIKRLFSASNFICSRSVFLKR
ncbi:hypothetical protein Hanom_Chr03g00268811 [Helianthus anomalus]